MTFQDKLKLFLERKPYELLNQDDTNQDELKFMIRIRESPPTELVGFAEAFIQDIRSSLDFLAWELSLLTTKDPPENTQFPIYMEPDKFKKNGASKIKAVPESARSIIEELQPYNQGLTTDPLWYVFILSDFQKHRRLAFTRPEVRISWQTGESRLAIVIGTAFRDGDTFVLKQSFENVSPAELDLKVDPVFSIRAEKSVGRAHVTVDSFGHLYSYVKENVISKFESFF